MEVSKPVLRTVGSVLLAFGFALTSLLILILVRHSGRPAELGAVVAGTIALTSLCFLLGYRLVLNRPNKRGSLLSPVGWRVLATCFGLVAFFVGSTTIRSPDGMTVAATLGAAAMAYACVMAARGHRIEPPPPSRVFPPETSLLQLGGFTPAGFRHGVEILNDDSTKMEFVVSVLQKQFGLNEPEAIRAMLDIHRNGGVILARESFEESKRIAEAVTEGAHLDGYSLTCRAVSVDGGARAESAS